MQKINFLSLALVSSFLLVYGVVLLQVLVRIGKTKLSNKQRQVNSRLFDLKRDVKAV